MALPHSIKYQKPHFELFTVSGKKKKKVDSKIDVLFDLLHFGKAREKKQGVCKVVSRDGVYEVF